MKSNSNLKISATKDLSLTSWLNMSSKNFSISVINQFINPKKISRKQFLYPIFFVALFFDFANFKIANAQTECGFDNIINQRLLQDPNFGQNIQNRMQQLHQFINFNANTFSANSISSNAIYVIPIVVHIVRDPSEALPVISYAQVESQINALNAAFSAPLLNASGNTQIQFCLAQSAIGATWSNSTEPGIMRYNNQTLSHNIMDIQGTDDLMVLTNSGGAFPFNQYLNIWIVNSINGPSCVTSGSQVQGYSLLPVTTMSGQFGYNLDGIVIRADVFGDNGGIAPPQYSLQPHSAFGTSCISNNYNQNRGKVLVHEVGHYLSLFHTFQPNIFNPTVTCAGANPAGSATNACDTDGDFCCDTHPVDASASGVIPYTCNTGVPSSCGFPLQYENFMCYSGEDCWASFTAGQKDIMQAYLSLYRSNLFTTSNLVSTGLIGVSGCLPPTLIAEFTSSPSQACINLPINFDPIGLTNNANTAVTFNWDFTGGNITTSTLQNPSVTYSTAGNYAVTLTVGDGSGTTVTYTGSVNVGNCSISPENIHNANWYFGQYVNLDFTSGFPVATDVAFVNQTVFSPGAGYSYCDDSGNLVFYTDGINVWDGNHQPIYCIDGVTNLFQDAGVNVYSNSYTGLHQPAISSYTFIGIPFPNHPNQYYIFNCANPWTFGAFYTVLDLNSATPTYSTPVMYTLPPSVNPYTYKWQGGLTIIPHCNGKDYWIIANRLFDVNGNNEYYQILNAYLLTEFGLSSNPVVSNISAMRSSVFHVLAKASPNGQKYVIQGLNQFAIWDFNNSTGVFSNETIYDIVYGGVTYDVGHFSFSPNSQQLYITSQPNRVFQLDVNSGNFTQILAGLQPMRCQLGPDNNIYCGNNDTPSNYYGVINNPDTPNNSSGFSYVQVRPTGYSLVEINTFHGTVPSFMDALKPGYTPPEFTFANLSCSSIEFTVDPCWQSYTATWNFGDGSPAITGSIVTHNYATTGIFTVTCSLTIPGLTGSLTVQHDVAVINNTVPISGNTNHCLGNNLTENYSMPNYANATYSWTCSPNGNIVGLSNSWNVNIDWVSGTTGTVNVTVTIPNCVINQTFVVHLFNNPTVTINPASPFTFCNPPNSVMLTATGSGTSFQWAHNNININGATYNTYTVSNPPLGTSTYSVIVSNAVGCHSSASIDVVNEPPPAQISSGGLVSLCTGSTVTLTANTGSGLTYQWQLNGSDITSANASDYTTGIGGDYTVIVTGANGCSTVSNTVTVTIPNPPNGTLVSLPDGFTSTDLVNYLGGISSPNLISTIVSGVPVYKIQQLPAPNEIYFNLIGQFIIDNQITFGLVPLVSGIHFECYEGAEIVNNSSLTMVSCTLKACSSRMWKGIVNNGKLDVSFSSFEDAQYAIYLKNKFPYKIYNHNTFTNNLYGIMMFGSTSNAVFTGNIYGNTFTNPNPLKLPYTTGTGMSNWKPWSEAGIRTYNAAFAQIGITNGTSIPAAWAVDNVFHHINCGVKSQYSNITLINNVFHHISPLNAATPGQLSGLECRGAAVFAYGTQSLAPRKVTIQQNTTLTNEFDNCTFGIKNFRSSLSATGVHMTNMGRGIYSENSGACIFNIQDNEITSKYGCITIGNAENANSILIAHNHHVELTAAAGTDAIRVSGSAIGIAGNTKIISNHVFVPAGNRSGIYTFKLNQPFLQCNYIKRTTFSSTSLTSLNAINTSSCDGATVNSNNIGWASGLSGTASSGNDLLLYMSDNSFVKCNTTGVSNRGIHITGANTNATIRANNIGRHNVGLYYSNTANPGMQPPGGSSDPTEGNRWLATSYGQYYAEFNTTNNVQISLNSIFVNPSQAPAYFPPSSGISIAGWFDPTGNANHQPLCSPSLCAVRIAEPIGNLDYYKYIANGTVLTSGYPAQTLWMAKGALIKRIEAQQTSSQQQDSSGQISLLDDEDISNFYYSPAAANIKAVAGIERSLNENPEAIIADNFAMLLNDSLMNILGNQLNTLSGIMTDSTTADTSDVLLYNYLLEQYQGLDSINNDIFNHLNNLNSQNIRNAIGLNNALAPENANEQIAKTVNEIYYRLIENEYNSFTEGDSDMLSYIAHLCPLAAGPAVFSARDMYAMLVDSVYYNDSTICENEGYARQSLEKFLPSIEQKLTDKTYLMVQPNPASEEALFTFNSFGSEGNLNIYSMNGELVYTEKIAKGATQCKVNISRFSRGVYIAHLLTNQGSMRIKLTVNK
ncbi:MAG TPA: PKD domain-containing protein [Bacteroidia bacterium]|nr:PKD domain-containing protein [Bacteroidia bacterium]